MSYTVSCYHLLPVSVYAGLREQDCAADALPRLLDLPGQLTSWSQNLGATWCHMGPHGPHCPS